MSKATFNRVAFLRFISYISSMVLEAPRLSSVQNNLAKRKFLRFVLHNKPDYRVNWHHRYICEVLDKFARREITNLMIFVPPQHGKSELSSRQFPAYKLGLDPNCRIAVCSYSGDLSFGFNRDAQRIIDTSTYASVFPDTKLNGKNVASDAKGATLRNSEVFEIVGHRGFFKAAYVRGPLTGTSVDLGIIDDPFKDRIEAESEIIRRNVWAWYTDVFKTRLHNGSQQLLLQTRWHEDDLAGRLLKEDDARALKGLPRKWTVISLPAIKENNNNPNDPRQIGEALWEEQHSKETILEQKESSPRTYNSLYQQNPRPLEGNIIKTEKFGLITWPEFLDRTKNREVIWQFKVDTAYTEKTQNDPSAILSACLVDNITYIRRVQSVRKELPALCEYIDEFAQANGYGLKSYIRIEPKASGLSVVQSIKKATTVNVEQYKFPRVRGVRMDDKDKIVRAHAITDIIQVGRVVLIEDGSGWTTTFKNQCSAFPNSTHDDEVDIFVMQLLEFYFGKDKKKIINRN